MATLHVRRRLSASLAPESASFEADGVPHSTMLSRVLGVTRVYFWAHLAFAFPAGERASGREEASPLLAKRNRDTGSSTVHTETWKNRIHT